MSDFLQGIGKYVWKNGDVFKGNFKNNKKFGKG